MPKSAEAIAREVANMQRLLALARARLAQNQPVASAIVENLEPEDVASRKSSANDEIVSVRESPKTENLEWDLDQQRALDAIEAGEDVVIIGAAGTGKTTILREGLRRLIAAGRVPPLSENTKWLQEGKPGAVVLSFTNKAVANIARGMPKDITCVTAHKLIEFAPIFYEVENSEGELTKTMRFEPTRNHYNPLPSTLGAITFEESGTISTDLFAQITNALSRKPQYIFLGDIQQLPPVYGKAILGFKMLEHKTIELTKVHRQAEDSPILAFAWEILDGLPMKIDYIAQKYNTEGKFFIRPWKKKLRDEDATHIMCLLLAKFIDSREFNPLDDMILIPFNKAFGTIELNRYIANKLGKERGAVVHEIIAGFQKFYFAVGDKILVQKQEAIIERIARNADYVGTLPLDASDKLNRWGHYDFVSKDEIQKDANSYTLEDMEALLAMQTTSDVEERKNQGSHILHCRFLDSEEEVEVQTTGEYMDTSFAYALTVYKAQGSEWKRVILILHQSHATAISRELLYTAVTRARESLYIMCEPEHFEKGILRQRIKGNTLAEKAEYFKGKILEAEETNGNGEMR